MYLIENKKDGGWYIGYSSNLKQRIADHDSCKGAKHTRGKEGWRLIYYEAYLSKQDAVGREKFLKSGSGRGFIKSNCKTTCKSEHSRPRHDNCTHKRTADM